MNNLGGRFLKMLSQYPKQVRINFEILNHRDRLKDNLFAIGTYSLLWPTKISLENFHKIINENNQLVLQKS